MDDVILEKLHSKLIEILDEIDRICRKYDIQYFLDSGTAIGAIRHAGFIPWDDDADVGMLREEYERFIKVAPGELSDKFFLQTRESDPGFEKFSAKLRLNGTYFPEERNEGVDINQGIFVDIFPFDYISDDKKQAVRDIKKTRRLIKMFALRHRHPKNENPVKKCIRALFRIIPENIFEKKCINHFKKYNETKTDTVVSYSYKMNNSHILLFNKADMYPSVDVAFYDRKYMIMNNYEAYLKTMYGNYMELPPENQRVWHIKGEIKFD